MFTFMADSVCRIANLVQRGLSDRRLLTLSFLYIHMLMRLSPLFFCWGFQRLTLLSLCSTSPFLSPTFVMELFQNLLLILLIYTHYLYPSEEDELIIRSVQKCLRFQWKTPVRSKSFNLKYLGSNKTVYWILKSFRKPSRICYTANYILKNILTTVQAFFWVLALKNSHYLPKARSCTSQFFYRTYL